MNEPVSNWWATLWDPAPEGEQCSVKECPRAAVYELAGRSRSLLFWLCREHWLQGLVRFGAHQPARRASARQPASGEEHAP